MKKVSFIFIFLLLFLVSCYDNSGVSEAFSKYSHEDGVTSITIPGFAIHMFTLVAGLEEEQEELLRNIDKVKILTIDGHQLNAKVNLHKEFNSIIFTNDYEEFLTVHDGKNDVSVYGKIDSENTISELIVLTGGEENALVFLKGHIDPNDLEKCIHKSESGEILSFKDFKF